VNPRRIWLLLGTAFTVALVAVTLWLVRPSAATTYDNIAEITQRAEAAGCDVHAFGDSGITTQCGPFESMGTVSMFTGENPRWEASVRADSCSRAVNNYQQDRWMLWREGQNWAGIFAGTETPQLLADVLGSEVVFCPGSH
jgi:hypothetical protein